MFIGEEDGMDCGLKLGDRVGIAVGRLVGTGEGFAVGDRDGSAVGRLVGTREGFAVGNLVGKYIGYSVCVPLILRVFIIKSRNNLKLIDPRPDAGSHPGAASNP